MAYSVNKAPPGYFEQRAREKQAARDKDERDLAEGRITKEELQKKNTLFAFPNARVNFRKSKLY
jgi:hypothetical protein